MKDRGDTGTQSLFETPSDRVLAACPPEIARLLRRYLEEEPLPVGDLRAQVSSYLDQVVATDGEFVDIEQAGRVASTCLRLLDQFSNDSPIQYRRAHSPHKREQLT
jgi:hypothetical protein